MSNQPIGWIERAKCHRASTRDAHRRLPISPECDMIDPGLLVRRCGGIGRRAWFRSMFSQESGGSTPSSGSWAGVTRPRLFLSFGRIQSTAAGPGFDSMAVTPYDALLVVS